MRKKSKALQRAIDAGAIPGIKKKNYLTKERRRKGAKRVKSISRKSSPGLAKYEPWLSMK
jgi:hypothetical protein